MVLNLLIDSLKQNKRRTMLIVLQCTTSYILIILTMSLTSNVYERLSSVQRATSTLYKVSDNFFYEEEKRFLAQSNHLMILNDLYEWEKTNPNFKYILASRQNLYLNMQGLPIKFQYGYEAGHETPDAYASVQVNQQFIDHYSIRSHVGRVFRDEDFDVKNTVIPILLGYEYMEYLDLEQIVKVGYMGEMLECKVIGFLEPHSFYNNGYILKSLDRLVIFPSLEVGDIHAEDRDFMVKLFLDKTSGYILSSLSVREIQEMYTQKSLQLDIEPYVLEGVSSFYLTMWGLEGEQLLKVLFVFALVIGFASLFSLSFNFVAKINLRKYTYGVMILNGTSRAKIDLSILVEIFIINLASLLIATSLALVFVGSVNLPVLLICNWTLSLISFIPPWISVQRLELSRKIRGGN